MKKLIYIFILLVIQYSTLGIQTSFAQAPINMPDNTGPGNCLDFDGVNDYVNCGTGNSMNIIGSLTLSCWFNLQGAVPDVEDARLIQKHLTWGDRQYGIAVDFDTNTIEFQLFNASSTAFILHSNTAIDQNQWYHVSAVYNQTTGVQSVYLNGELDGSSTIGNITLDSRPSLPLTLGAYWANVGYTAVRGMFPGQIDEAQVWNRALTQTEIRDNMCHGLVGNETGLIGYWNMNEGSGNTVGDLTSNNNNGTRQ